MNTQEEIKQEAESFLGHKVDNYIGKTMEELKVLMDFECSEVEADRLTRAVTDEEIREVLFGMSSNKAPRLDGFTTKIFKESWRVVKKDFVIAVQSFFEKGLLPKGINSTILALIPR